MTHRNKRGVDLLGKAFVREPAGWLAAPIELGNHIGIEQEPAHRSMGRP